MYKILKNIFFLVLIVTGLICNVNTILAETQPITVFNKQNNIWDARYFRIPSLQILDDGTLLAFSDIRYNGASDHGYIDIGLARSTDGGKTWKYQVVMENDRKNPTYSRVMDSTTVVTKTGRIILIAGSWNTNGNWANTTTSRRSDWSVQMVYSDDNGLTWSHKIDLTTNNLRVKNQPSNTIGWLGGVGSGIVMDDGTIVVPAQIALRENTNKYYSTIIYSKDNGETWTMGSKVPQPRTSENMVIELDGALIMSARYDNSGYRAAYISYNLGKTWKEYEPLHGKILTGTGSGCQGSFIKVTASNGHRLGLISAPKNTVGGYVRDNITVYMIDFDDLSKGVQELGVPYPERGNPAGGGYSSLAFNNDTLGILYEADGNIAYKDITPYYPVPEGVYNIMPKLRPSSALVRSYSGLGVSLVSNYDKYSSAAKWEFIYDPAKNAYKIMNLETRKFLTDAYYSMMIPNALHAISESNDDSHYFKIKKFDNNEISLINLKTNLAITWESFGSGVDSIKTLTPYKQTNNQKFLLEIRK